VPGFFFVRSVKGRYGYLATPDSARKQWILHYVEDDCRATRVLLDALLGLSQPKVSALLGGDFVGYSQERLFWLLNRLGCDVRIVVTPAPRGRAVGRVSVAFA
jgi:hypothetical protein